MNSNLIKEAKELLQEVSGDDATIWRLESILDELAELTTTTCTNCPI